MSTNASPWNQHPEFMAACNRQIPLGGANSYSALEPAGNSQSDVTDFIWGQRDWSETNLPDILYMLEPPVEWKTFMASDCPPQKLGRDGQPLFGRFVSPSKGCPNGKVRTKELYDFQILPDKISTQVPWWKIEAWRRLDPRIEWCDILMRMELGDCMRQNALKTECFRWRGNFSMVSWYDIPAARTSSKRGEVLRDLTPAQLAMNSTRGSTPGLKDPSLGEQGGRVPLPKRNRPARKTVAPMPAGPPRIVKSTTNQQMNPKAMSSTTPWSGVLQPGSSSGVGSFSQRGYPGRQPYQMGPVGDDLQYGSIYRTDPQSLPVHPRHTFGDARTASATLHQYDHANDCYFPPQMESASFHEQPRQSSVTPHTQDRVPIESRKRPFLDSLDEHTTSAQDVRKGITPHAAHHSFESAARAYSPITYESMPSFNQPALHHNPTWRPLFDQGEIYEYRGRFGVVEHPMQSSTRQRSYMSPSAGVSDTIPNTRAYAAQIPSSLNLGMNMPISSGFSEGATTVQHGFPQQFRRVPFGSTYEPQSAPHVRQYRAKHASYHGDLEQVLPQMEHDEQWSELPGQSDHSKSTLKVHIGPGTPTASGKPSQPSEGHGKYL